MNHGIRSMVNHRDDVVAFMAAERLAAGVTDEGIADTLSDLWQMGSPCHGALVKPHRVEPRGKNWYDAFDMECATCHSMTPAALWYEARTDGQPASE